MSDTAAQHGFAPGEVRFDAHPERRPGELSVGLPKGVKVTHLPTGLSVVSEQERSQFHNAQTALRQLREAVKAAVL